MWWNRSKTPPRSQEGQLRELSQRVAEMESDFEKVFNLIAKINGRLRQRERRADDADRRDDGAERGDGDSSLPDYVAPVQAVQEGARERESQPVNPTYTKDQLRQMARARGLLH